MRLHNRIASSDANGPESRAVVWFAGCNLACAGCWNPSTHSFNVPETPNSSVKQWLQSLSEIQGVTFSGGEPLQSLPDLLDICLHIRQSRPALSLGIFTGYTLRELEAGRFEYWQAGRMVSGNARSWSAVRELLDFAVCGRFNQSRKTALQPLCGSDNQRIELFSTRYTMADFSQQIAEVTISDDGLVQITGFPSTELLTSIKGAF